MNNKTNIYYVESPGQIISAIEAIYLYKNNNAKLFVRLNGEKYNDEQIKQTILFYQQKVKIKFEVHFINNLLKFIFTFVLTCRKSKGKKFVGCHKSKYIKLMSYFTDIKDHYLLDDGIATLIYQDKGGHGPLFTCLDIKGKPRQEVVRHNFNCLKSIPTKEKVGAPIFFGAKYVEAGIISLNSYVEILKGLINTKGNLIYVAHRAEKDENLEIYKSLGVSIVRFRLPSEIELLLRKDKPKEIYGIYSASLITSKIINPKMKVFYIRPSSLLIDKEVEDLIYSNMKQYNISELEING
ncbi:hypothetical protein ACQEXU_12700 [Vibrio sp. TRT 21S02]|uniref:hypothetical protein n=1 Tax=Vibrio sp. TRT 21S02 TaxID=3418507 RepID=UPI003CF6F2D9